MNVTAFENAYLSRIHTIEQSEEINLRVANALRFVIQNVFASMTSTFVFTLSTNGTATEFWLHDIMEKLFATWGLIAVQLVVLDSKTAFREVPGKRYCNMIMVDSFESLRQTKIAEYNRHSDAIEYYYIFLQVHDSKIEKEVAETTRYCFDNYWIHCNIMVQNSRGEIAVYTYFPFKENNCFKTQPELINRFVDNKFENHVMFPDKLSNLHGCPLKLSTWETAPFVKNKTNKITPNISIGGFEIYTLIAFSKKMNFTLDVEWLSIEMYGQNKSTETVPMSRLMNYDTNFTMGYFRRTADRDKVATPTVSVYYIPMVAVILRKDSNHNSMGMWSFPFDAVTWFAIIVGYTLIGMLNVFESIKFKGGVFEIYGMIIGMPINMWPNYTSTRVRLITIIISSFVIRSVYQALLFHAFRTNFYRAIPLTFDSLVRDNYTAIATELNSKFLLHVPQIEEKTLPLKLIYNTNEMYPLHHLELYRNESLVAMTIYEFAVRYVSREMSKGGALQILPINVKDQQICLYLPKHSYLSGRVDTFVLYLHQAGLLKKWREWIIYEYQVLHLKAKRSATDNTFMVNANQLVGFLRLVVFLLSTSFVLFVLELLSKKCKWLQKTFEMNCKATRSHRKRSMYLESKKRSLK